MDIATARRLHDELNIEAPLEFVYKFTYQAQFNDSGAEHELCHVFLGRVDSDVKPNEHEIAAIRYVAPAELHVEMAEGTRLLTPWFRMEWQTLIDAHRDSLARYCEV